MSSLENGSEDDDNYNILSAGSFMEDADADGDGEMDQFLDKK